MSNISIVAQTNENTVVAEYEPSGKRSGDYQTEAELEREFIRVLCEQGYDYSSIHKEKDLIDNLRRSLEELNHYRFSDMEWKRFFSENIANQNEGIAEKTRKIQDDSIQVLKCDDGSQKNIILIDKKNIHNNKLQVINQYAVANDNSTNDNRYDVTVLINGFPLVHMELKRRGIPIREAYNQIGRYAKESFFKESGLFEYIQIYVISNGTETKYYSNSTRLSSLKNAGMNNKGQKINSSFDFTSYWADSGNKTIPDLMDFAKTFFAKNTILNIITRYCVYTTDNTLMVMRPYQITASERILNQIDIANNYKKYGSTDGGGYIWHTTGSGKTLTSFKTAQLAVKIPYIDKVLFVVDRRDLDYQTVKEYDKFEKGSANGNTSTDILKRQLEDDSGIIITTIQKLSVFIKKNPNHPVYQKHIVIIVDECHRSQFGAMHRAIAKNFKKHYIIGFTGTPIFADNADLSDGEPNCTTEQLFGKMLHAYTIVDAINDKNVLPFRIDYIQTMNIKSDMIDKLVNDIDRERAYMAPQRIVSVTEYILDHFDQKTYRGDKSYVFDTIKNVGDIASDKTGKIDEIKQKQRVSGFNSIFAVGTIPMAKLYYSEFKKQMQENPTKKLNIAVIYSYSANETDPDGGIIDDENSDDASALNETDKDFLFNAMKDYDSMFGTSYSEDGSRFADYYKDVSMRLKNKELDLLIVVNMFLTGFDAPTLNTLWLDKNVKMHGLIQAFSRTNRIMNDIKRYGNIVCFRNLKDQVDVAISLFGNKEANGVILMKGFADYYSNYIDKVSELKLKYPLPGLCIVGEQNQKDFIAEYGEILRYRNLLSSFDEFPQKDILTARDVQDYSSYYQDLRDEWIKYRYNDSKENIIQDVVFEIDLIKQDDVGIDYIFEMIRKYRGMHQDDREITISIQRIIDSSPELRSKKELITSFVSGINDTDDVLVQYKKFIAENRSKEIEKLICEENLKEKETRDFIDECIKNKEVKEYGISIGNLMKPMSRFDDASSYKEKHERVVGKIKAILNQFSL